MPRPPVIGLPVDYIEPRDGTPTYSLKPFYAIRENYCASLSACGAIPLPLPLEPDHAEYYFGLLDGLVIIGGDFDVPPHMYGDDTVHPKVTFNERRTAFEKALLERCLTTETPVLGICGGMQLMNVVLGGSLIQHIPDALPDALPHEQPNPRTEPGHDVTILEGTQLHRIVGRARIPVNSAHHQAVRELAPGAVQNALCPDDNVIEGFEYPAHPFCLGVQWHPEYAISPADHALFSAFVDACNRTL